MKNKYSLSFFISFLSLLLLSGCSLKDTSESSKKDNKPEKRSYDLIEEALAEKNSLTTNDFVMGINKLTAEHFKGIVNGKDGIVLAAKKKNDWNIVFDGVFGSEKSYSCKSVRKYDFPDAMIKDCTE